MSDDDLVSLRIEGTAFEVPKGEVLLACIHYIVRDRVPVLGRFCWSDECGNCEMSVTGSGELLPRRRRGCQTVVEREMQVSELSPDLRYWLSDRLG